jgi:uncharacterized membrane protein HdeD (DUF308 family)
MNWRAIIGLILLIMGVRVLYIAMDSTTHTSTYGKIGGFVWITVGVFFILKAMTHKKEL